jgi:hypothetical protein
LANWLKGKSCNNKLTFANQKGKGKGQKKEGRVGTNLVSEKTKEKLLRKLCQLKGQAPLAANGASLCQLIFF